MGILMPKKVKHRKWHKGVSKGIENRATEINFGKFALKSLDTRWLTARQIESSRRYILRYLKKGGKLWIRVFPDKPVTFKGAEVGMGGGKGGVDHYVYAIRPGRIIFEVDGAEEKVAREALRKAGTKLPLKTRIISRVHKQ